MGEGAARGFAPASPTPDPTPPAGRGGGKDRAPVAQLDRASAFGAEGWGFESLRACSAFCHVSLLYLMTMLRIHEPNVMSTRLDLRRRHRQPEIMDQPGLDRAEHFHALRGIERINRWSGSARILWPALRQLGRELAPRPVRVLDLATGAGDVPSRLWHKARRAGLTFELTACDVNPQAVEYAQQRAADHGARVLFRVADVINDPLPTGYDAVMCSLFLHHLDEEQAVGLLRRMAAAAERLVLVNDLKRSLVGYWLAVVGTRIFTTSKMNHVDGPRSVEGAFTLAEARALAQQAGLNGARVESRWPCRYLLTWRKT